jgi:3-oxoacyl-[acyl-carrier protein] reductase
MRKWECSWNLKGKVALVTGASQGIGFASAMALAKAGAGVAIMARRKEILLEARDKIIADSKGKVIAIPGDVSDPLCFQETLKQIERELGRVDILVNNAGGPKPGAFMEIEQTDWDNALTQNLKSVILFSKAVIPGMKAAGWGRIINIASTSVKEPIIGMVLSNAIRAAVAAIAKTMSLELSGYGITINTVCPGPTYTDRAKSLIENRSQAESLTTEEIIAQIVANVPVGRFAQPDEIAVVISFLASDLASYITGIVLTVDGGLTRSLY